MPRSGGRLSLTGALNRNMPPSHLNPLMSEPSSKRASVCQLERELKTVKEENSRLKEELEDTRSALKEITSEANLEKFDERRVNMLKMQNIQLQRQVLLLSEALGSRSTALMEVENALTWLSGKFRHYIGVDVKGPEVPVSRSDLITMVDTSESARIKLFKNIENCNKENLSRPQMLMNSFLKPGLEKQSTMLDCCLGRFDCLNLKHVAQLESKLSTLYKELVKVSEYLASRAGTKDEGHVSSAVREREGTVVLRACAMSRDCAADLLSLSLLFPSAPWPPLKKPTFSEVTYDALAPSLPPLPKGKAVEVQRCVTAALKACNHRCYMVSQEAGALREEVRFHQAVYHMQLDYVQQAFDALRQGYTEFEHSTNEVVVQPMKKLLAAYRMLKNKTSQEGLREFLTLLKEQETQWTDTILKLDTTDPQNQSGSVALSAFGQEFLTSLDRLVLTRQTQRDKATSQKEELKVAQQQLEEELRALIRDREEQQKIAKELKGTRVDADAANDSKVEPDTSRSSHRNSSYMHEPSEEQTEVVTGLRPWLDEHNTEPNSGRKKRGKKPQTGSVMNQKPWQDVGDVENATGTGLRPWLDEDQSVTQTEGKQTETEGITGLRPWLDQQSASEENQKRSNQSVKERKSGEFTLLHEDSDMHVLTENAQKSLHDREIIHSHRHQDGTDSERSERLPYLDSDRHLEPLHLAQNGRQFSFQLESGLSSVNPLPSKPPFSTDSSSKRPPAAASKEKARGQAKPRSYEPKLYVANRTLSLRRSGSLTKLSEPSLQEQMSKMSASSQQSLDSSRASSRKSSR